MEKPVLSKDFTVEDIHKLREWIYEQIKDMTPEEQAEYYRKSGDQFMAELEERRARMKAEESSDAEDSSEDA